MFFENLLSGRDEPVDINDEKGFATSEASRQWWLTAMLLPKDEFDSASLVARRAELHAYLAGLGQGSVFLKTHSAHIRVGRIPLFAPQHTAAAIYIMRNPLDIVFSLANHLGVSELQAIRTMGDQRARLSGAKRNVPEFMSSWSIHIDSWTRSAHPRLFIVRYEDLLENPTEKFTAMARHVGLDSSPADIEKAIRFSSFETLQRQEREKGFREAPEGRVFFRAGRKGQWQDQLKDRLIRRLIREQGRVMAKFGYLPDGFEAPVEAETEANDELFVPFDCAADLAPPSRLSRPSAIGGFTVRI